ncbi:kinase [Fictibacillus phosphorivorans]|uniref:GHMP family kinase ATP-binding protein n=1 Tax=Fictibacillus phosphorivorans TaxID=1221500 RepID=UPI0021B27B02|nr:kinase [Fictibacillus phosphorivorans]
MDTREGTDGMKIKEPLPLSTKRQGYGRSCGTFGELLQGVLPNEQNFLVTFPIEMYSTCTFVPIDGETLSIMPEGKVKSLQLAKRILEFYELPLGGHLLLNSELQQGKGLASSTADMVATARAIEDYYDFSIPVILLEDFIREIEPSDGIMHAGVVVYYHKELRLKEALGDCPSFTILGIDEGGEVDTVQFNRTAKPFTKSEKQEYESLLSQMCTAFKSNDLEWIGKICTRSAILNQKLRPKKHLEHLITICQEIGGIGVVTAHSGTYIGMLLHDRDPQYQKKLSEGTNRLKGLGYPVQSFHSITRETEVMV